MDLNSGNSNASKSDCSSPGRLKDNTPKWLTKPIVAILMDISGVLKDGDTPIPGSLEAFEKLQRHGKLYRLVTNETQLSKSLLCDHLNGIGFKIPSPDFILSPSPVLAEYLSKEGLRPKLLVHQNVSADFDCVDQLDPNCLVIGDAAERFTYSNMNEAFRFLMGDPSRRFFTLGRGKFYKLETGLSLDVGPFTTALEFSTGRNAELIGKPSATFFEHAVQDLRLQADQVIMIGDDVVGDVKGAQDAGMRGVLVKTGKYRNGDESRDGIGPDAVVNNLLDAITQIFQGY